MSHDIERVALHESCHACCTVLLDCKVDHVVLVRDDAGDWSGHCLEVGRRTPRGIADRITIIVAGGIGEMIQYGDAYGCGTDDKNAAKLIDQLCRMTGDHHDIAWFERRARLLLEANWSAVKLVAKGLVLNRRVEGPQLLRWISYAI